MKPVEIIECSIAVMAHNEEKNIAQVLNRLLEQRLRTVEIAEIIVIASGCTDRTEEIARKVAPKNKRIKILTQKKRHGKAAAVNLFLRKAEKDILVVVGADLLPQKDAIERLVSPFSHPAIGMTGARAIPVNDPSTLMGFATHLLWDLCHKLSLKHPKMGEMIAFRKIFERIPYSSAVDEANIEPLIVGQEYNIRYVPEAIVHNKGPETITDFLRQRRRVFAGHLLLKKNQGYSVSTLNGLRIFWIFLRNLFPSPRFLIWSSLVILLEIYGRLLGVYDFLRGHPHTVWEIAKTTKEVIVPPEE